MTDDMTAALQEIAGLLRQRVEQHDEQDRRAEESRRESKAFQAIMERQRQEMSDLAKFETESKQRFQERMQTTMEVAEQRRQQDREEKERFVAADREFKGRLLAEIERHNALLEHLLARMERQ